MSDEHRAELPGRADGPGGEATPGADSGDRGPARTNPAGRGDAVVHQGLARFAFAEGNRFFLDQYGRACAWVRVPTPASHFELFPVDSADMERWLVARAEAETGVTPDRGEIADVGWLMEARAGQSPRRELHTRFVWRDGGIDLDTADEQWRVVRVTAGGWSVVAGSEPVFRRYTHQLPLYTPEPGGSLADLAAFLPPVSDADRLLILCWVVAACVPSIPRPMLHLVGEHGGSKSTSTRRIRSLIDPSRVPLLGEDQRRDLLLTFEQHAVPAFDNLGPFSRAVADQFCRAVTGGGTYRRKLYTDTGGVILSYRRAMILNGLRLPSPRADFVDRSLVVRVRRHERHRPERELDAEFDRAAPRLLGAILDTLSRCLRVVDDLPAPEGFRMADFARWGRAVAATLGRDPAEFDAAYRAALLRQSGDVAECDPVALAVLEYAAECKDLPRELTADEFFPALARTAARFRAHGVEWPASRESLSARLSELKPTLEQLGVRLTKLGRTGRCRSRWRLERVTPR
jgi:hypothetical protein